MGLTLDRLTALPPVVTAPTDTDLARFCEQVQGLVNAHHTNHYPNLTPPVVEFERGQKFARIIKSEPASRSAYAFVDLSNGDILKADGWKRPAKGARGNIFGNNPLDGCTPHGTVYKYR